MIESLLFLLVGVIIANVFLTLYLFRRASPARPKGISSVDADAQTDRILTEIHRVTSANVELLEGRIDALREVGVLADERLRRIRSTLTDLEVLLNRVHRVKKSLGESMPAGETSVDTVSDDAAGDAAPPIPLPEISRPEWARDLRRQGLTDQKIADRMGIGVAEVRFLFRLADGGKVPVESK